MNAGATMGGDDRSLAPFLLAASQEEIARMIGRARESVVEVHDRRRGGGAGVICDKDGLVLTNAHVVSSAATFRNAPGVGVRVTLHSGRGFGAQIVKADRSLDLALLRLEGRPDDLPAAPIGDSNSLRVGDLVFAIGHPWGMLGTATAGIVSGRDEAHSSDGGVEYVRSDVLHSPGNSGGPLLNSRGEVVGVNAMISGGTALSIPAGTVRTWMVDYSGEQRSRLLGVAVRPVRLPNYMRLRNARLPEVCLLLVAVGEGSPAGRAGLLTGDVLIEAAGEALGDAGALQRILSHAGSSVVLRIMRGGEVSSVEVDLKLSGPGRAA